MTQTLEEMIEGFMKEDRAILIDCEDLYYEAKNIINALLAEREERKWLPIEEAPKDGTYIWLSNGFTMRVGFWGLDCWVDKCKSEQLRGPRGLNFQPTVFMYCPTPPERAKPPRGEE